jgi:hypothetical protein
MRTISDEAVALALETGFSPWSWQDALNMLGPKGEALIPYVKEHATRLRLAPAAAAAEILYGG